MKCASQSLSLLFVVVKIHLEITRKNICRLSSDSLFFIGRCYDRFSAWWPHCRWLFYHS